MPYIEASTTRRRDKLQQPERLSAFRKTSRNTSNHREAALISPDKPLTDQQKEFCRFVAEGNPVPTAMHLAGYNDQTSYGYRMMKMPNIKRQIAIQQKLFAEAAEISRKGVMEMLKESYEMAKLMSEPATMVSAAREIGKMCGYYEPKKIQVDVTMSGTVKYEQLSDAELFAMIEKAAKEAEEVEQGLLEGPESASGDDFDAD